MRSIRLLSFKPYRVLAELAYRFLCLKNFLLQNLQRRIRKPTSLRGQDNKLNVVPTLMAMQLSLEMQRVSWQSTGTDLGLGSTSVVSNDPFVPVESCGL